MVLGLTSCAKEKPVLDFALKDSGEGRSDASAAVPASKHNQRMRWLVRRVFMVKSEELKKESFK